jgi:hypothetical protein
VIVYRRTAGALLVWFGVGCQPQVTCPEDGTPCGGDPSSGNGTWNVAGPWCRDPAYGPPLQVTYLGQPVQLARQPSPTTTSSDWCSSLVFGSQGITSFAFPHDTLAITGGQLAYTSDGSDAQRLQGMYTAAINTAGRGEITLSPECLKRAGVPKSCDEVSAQLTAFAATKLGDPGVPCTDSPSEPLFCQFFYSYQNITCAGAGDNGGCRCTYDVAFAGAASGRWRRVGSVLTHSDRSRMLPYEADYCVDETRGSLAMWGHDRTALFNMSGLRTLNLQRAP